jgi:hypothetical protein
MQRQVSRPKSLQSGKFLIMSPLRKSLPTRRVYVRSVEHNLSRVYHSVPDAKHLPRRMQDALSKLNGKLEAGPEGGLECDDDKSI